MPTADTKKVQSFIQGLLPELTKLESVNENLQNLRGKWLAHNPNLAGSNLTVQNVADTNYLVNAINALLIDHAAIIGTLKSKNHESHGTKSLN